MRITYPYRCDTCASEMQSSEGWYLISSLNLPGIPSAIAISAWNAQEAEIPEHKHLCSLDCAMKMLSKLIPEELHKEEMRRERQTTA